MDCLEDVFPKLKNEKLQSRNKTVNNVQRSILGTVIILVVASLAHSDMLFYASYDSSLDAEIAVGSGRPLPSRGTCCWI